MTAAVLLTFSNDRTDPERNLRHLPAEGTDISTALAPLVKKRALVIAPAVYNAKVGDVIAAFRDGPYQRQIRVFHFGGHASDTALQFDDQQAHAGGLAGYLGKQRKLVLVFLNGCSTEAQVQQLRGAGVKAVVATTSAIQDAVAADFARAFYAELVSRPLKEAFDSAVSTVKTHKGDDPSAVLRDMVPEGEDATAKADEWPWLLRYDPAYEDWRLPPRRWWPWLAVAAAVIVAAVIAVALAMGGGAKGPSADEERQWAAAIADPSEDGLIAYQRAYPQGHHAVEAMSRRQACRTEIEAGAGPEKTRRLEQYIREKLLDPLPTREAAEADVMAQARADATERCRPPLESEKLVSATPDGKASCVVVDGKHTCSFSGWAICVVRPAITRKICNQRAK